MSKKQKRLRIGAGLIALVVLGSLLTTLYKPSPVGAAPIAIIGSNTAVTATGVLSTTITIAKPVAVVTGSAMVVHLAYNAGANKLVTVTPASGWTQAGGYINNGNWWESIFYKVATATEAANYTFTISRASNITAGILAFSGVDATTPIDDVIGYTSGATTSTVHSAPSASASTNGDMMINFWGYLISATATSYDATLTANYSVSTSNVGNASAGKLLNNAGVTGIFNSNTAASTKWLAHTVLLLPAARPAGISKVGTSTGTCTNCTNQAVAVPTNTTTGDFLITSVFWNTTATLTAPDASWIQIGTTQINTGHSMADFYHIVAVGDAATYTWLFNAPSNVVINTITYAGVDTAAPIDDNQIAVDAAVTTTHTAPSVTSLNSNDYYVGIWGYEGAFIASTTAFTATLNPAWNNYDGLSIGSVSKYEPLGNAGPSGTRYTTSVNPTNNSQTRNCIAIMRALALKPFIPLPKLYAPVSGATGQVLKPTFQLKDYLIAPGPERYKIDVCTNSTCTALLGTYDQTVSQTGWSGQDVLTATAYNGTSSYATSTMANYTLQTPLTPNTQYWWRGYAYDVNGAYFTPPSNISTFTTSVIPAAPTLFNPSAGASNVPLNPEFRLASTDADGDDLQYKIQLCSTATCSAVLYTFDQTLSQTGWSGQDNPTFTAYGSDPTIIGLSTVAFYTFRQANLTQNTQYYWRAYAIDPLGTNTFSAASVINGFTTNLTETKILEGRIFGSRIL